MSRLKDRKLKKLKRQQIWPYILGIVLAVIIFSSLSVMILTFFLGSLTFDKLSMSYDHTKRITEIISDEWNPDAPEETETICDNIISIMPYVGGICIVNSDREIVLQAGADKPDWEYHVSDFIDEEIGLILTNEENDFIHINDEAVEINLDALFGSEAMEKLDLIISQDDFNSGNTITNVSFWYEMPMNDEEYSVCVKNVVPVKASEIIMVAGVLLAIAVFSLVLIIYYVISMFSLIFERRKLSKILATDVVTGGFNLQFFIKKGNRILKKNARNKINSAVVIIRMEKYRNFCSCYGVREGEELLENFYLVLQKSLFKRELVAHGEKADFALLLTYKDENELTERLNMLVDKLNNVKATQKKYFSVGIYRAGEATGGIDTMFNCAGVAISSLSEDNENRMVWFNDEMQREQLWVRKVENDMENALKNKEFQVYLQPKYSTKEEVLSGAEALVRWIHPTEGFVAPYRFIPIFEKDGFVVQLDDYMITEVARQQAKWLSEGKKIVPISVNVSRVHFVREDLAEHICELVDQFNVPHEYIELELTESAFFDDKGMLLNTINKLKAYGFEISMDDFGSGYSSLNSLKELPLDVLKLDAGFFRQEDKTGRGKLIVGDTISLAKKLDMRIVAEGIETREQVDFLATLDCDLIQGYYFAKPMPINEFEEKAFS